MLPQPTGALHLNLDTQLGGLQALGPEDVEDTGSRLLGGDEHLIRVDPRGDNKPVAVDHDAADVVLLRHVDDLREAGFLGAVT